MFEQGMRQCDVVRELGVAKSTASKWHARWREGGREALRARRATGRPRRLSDAELEQLEAALLQGPQAQGHSTELWTLPRITKLIAKRFGVRYHPSHVWKLLRQMGWSCQKPARQAKERNEAAIQHWRRYVWPAVKRGPCAQAR
jgi:transposase